MDPKNVPLRAWNIHICRLHINLLFLNLLEAIEKTQKVHRSQVKNYLLKAKDKVVNYL